MFSRILSVVLVCVVFVGCRSSRQVNHFPYTDEGVLKPRVAIASVTDSSGVCYPWRVSEEILHGVSFHLKNEGKLYLLPQTEVDANVAHISGCDSYGADISQWKSFCQADYVVLVDIFERDELPFEKGKFFPLYPTNGPHSNTVLAIKLRLKVIDIRGVKPRVVLYEVMESNFLLPWDYQEVDYSVSFWGDESYRCTPIGYIHSRLVYQIADRLKMVINDIR